MRRLKTMALALPVLVLLVVGVTGTAAASSSGVHRLVNRVVPGRELDGVFSLLDPTLGAIDPVVQLLGLPGIPAQGTCAGQEPTIIGTEGDDVIEGTPGPDVIVAGSGDDTIDGNGGRDYICGGKGNDFVRWTSSEFVYPPDSPWIYGGDGNDTIGVPLDRSKTGGSDHLFGGNGEDKLYGGHGDDDLHGGPGNDQLRGEAGTDLTDGGGGVDTCDNDASGDVGVNCEV